MFMSRLIDKENLERERDIYIYMYIWILLNHKNKILLFLNLEDIMLCEIRQKRQILYEPTMYGKLSWLTVTKTRMVV